MLPKKHLITLAALEGIVMFSAMIRMALPGGIDFARLPQLAWFICTIVLSASAVAHYVVRGGMLLPRLKAGEPMEDELKQILGLSLALVGLAGLISLAGPGVFERVLG